MSYLLMGFDYDPPQWSSAASPTIHLSLASTILTSSSSLGMGTRRPGTRQDLGPETSRGLAEESRDFLYITQPSINIGHLII